jgi:hypothetical protein
MFSHEDDPSADDEEESDDSDDDDDGEEERDDADGPSRRFDPLTAQDQTPPAENDNTPPAQNHQAPGGNRTDRLTEKLFELSIKCLTQKFLGQPIGILLLGPRYSPIPNARLWGRICRPWCPAALTRCAWGRSSRPDQAQAREDAKKKTQEPPMAC